MKLNKAQSAREIMQSHPTATANYEGGLAFNMNDHARLYSRVASCFVGEKKFYMELDNDGKIVSKNQDNLILKDIAAVAKQDPEFILKLAAYCRNVLNMRTISIVLLVEASLINACKPFVREYTPAIIQRADELAEATAYLQCKIGDIGNHRKEGSMPKGLQKGLAESFCKFDEYQFAKYNRDGLVKLKDVLKLVHPTPKTKEQSALFKRILTQSLKTPDTWEVKISTEGSTKENWQEILPKMGYMAVLRNLRNLLDKQVDIRPALALLSDAEQVKRSKQLPFRFLSAYRELQENTSPYTSKVLDALETALDHSADNLPKLSGTTLITSDNSQSMTGTISEKSTVRHCDIANLMLCIAHKMCEFPITSIFGDTYKIKTFSQRSGILQNTMQIRQGEVGCSTNAYLAIQHLIDNRIKVDRIILFSDQQCYDSNEGYHSVAELLVRYRREINPRCFMYSVDLAGYGTLQIPEDDPKSCMISGWSDKILEYIPLFEEDGKTAVERIKEWKYEPRQRQPRPEAKRGKAESRTKTARRGNGKRKPKSKSHSKK